MTHFYVLFNLLIKTFCLQAALLSFNGIMVILYYNCNESYRNNIYNILNVC